MFKRILIFCLACFICLSGCTKREIVDKLLNGESSITVKEEQSKQNLEKEESSKTAENSEDERVSESNQALLDFQNMITAAGDYFGIAYLGYYDGEYDGLSEYMEIYGFYEEFPFLREMSEYHSVFVPGYQLYAVVPANEEVTISIYDMKFVENDSSYSFVADEQLLFSDDGQLIILRCNESDSISNLLISASKNGEVFEYCPGLSMMDGSVITEEGMYDFTSYALIDSFYGEPEGYYYLCGTWYSTWWSTEFDCEMHLELTLNEDGTAAYSYGPVNSEVWDWFDGTWSADEMYLYLDLYGGPVDMTEETVLYEINSTYTWAVHNYAMDLYHEEGTPLMSDGAHSWFSFLPFDGWHYVNYWTTPVNESGWYYDLVLNSDGMCYFDYITENGDILVSYEGSWGVSDGYLILDMWHIDGQNPDDPDLELISGYYLASVWDYNSLMLEYMGGDILTSQMEEDGYAEFTSN